MTTIIEQAIATDRAMLALGSEVFEAQGAVFVRNPRIAAIYDANHVTNVTASTPAEIDRLLARAEQEYAGCNHRRFDVDYRTPPSFVARLVIEGYERSDALLLVLDRGVSGEPVPCDIRPVVTEKDWEAYTALHLVDWREYHEKAKLPVDETVAAMMMTSRRSKQPPLRHWLAWEDGRPVAYMNSWEGIEGIGQVEDLFTHPEYRRRGIATSLIHHCVADCRRKGAGPVVIAASATDTPKAMYAALGFRPTVVCSHYLKTFKPRP